MPRPRTREPTSFPLFPRRRESIRRASARTGRGARPVPRDSMRPVIPAKAGTYWPCPVRAPANLPPSRHSRVGGIHSARKRHDGARRALSPFDPKRRVIPAKAGTYWTREAPCPPLIPKRRVIPSKAGTYWPCPVRAPANLPPSRPARVGGIHSARKRHDGARRALSPFDPKRRVIPAKAGTYWTREAPARWLPHPCQSRILTL